MATGAKGGQNAMIQEDVDRIVAEIENRIYNSTEDTYTGMDTPEVAVRMQRDDSRLATATVQQVHTGVCKWLNSR